MARETSDSEQLAREYLESVWNQRGYAEIPTLVPASFVMYDPTAPADGVPGPAGEVHGPDGLETFIRGVVAGFPDFHVEVIEMLAEDDVAMYDGRLTMTHEGHFFGVPPTGRRVEVRYMGAVRIADGAIGEHRVYPPMRAIAEQLGFTSLAVVPYLPRLAWGLLKRRLSSRQPAKWRATIRSPVRAASACPVFVGFGPPTPLASAEWSATNRRSTS